MSRWEETLERIPSRLLGMATAALLFFVLLGLVIWLPDIASNTQSSKRTDDLNACRAQYRAEVDKANYAALSAFGDVQAGIAGGIVAAIQQDPTTLAIIATDLTIANTARDEALDGLLAAAESYEAAVKQSQEDPDGFLATCQGEAL